MRLELVKHVLQHAVQLGQLVAHLDRVRSVHVARVVGLVKVQRAEVYRLPVICVELDETIDELLVRRSSVVRNVENVLVVECDIGADPLGRAASAVSTALICRPDRLGLLVLSEPLDGLRVGVGVGERLIQLRVEHVILNDAVRLLVQAGDNGPDNGAYISIVFGLTKKKAKHMRE